MKLLISSSFIVLLLILSCSEYKKSNDTQEVSQKKKIPKYVKVIKYNYSFGVQDTIGEISKESKFDSNGNVTENKIYVEGKIYNKWVSKYDSLNRIIELIIYGKDGTLKMKTVYDYNSKGNINFEKISLGMDLDYIDKIIYHADKLSYRYDYLNDSLISRKVVTNGKGVIKITEYEYDNHNRLIDVYEINSGKKIKIEKLNYYVNVKLSEHIYFNPIWEYTYNVTGDTIKIKQYDKIGKITFSRLDILDSDGKYVETKGYDELGEPKFINKYYYEYY
ncbi:MAG: hypothetical protein ABI638_11835 [Ignavibacteriota bacterium]